MLLLIGTPVAAYFFRFQPRNQEIREAREEIARKREKLHQLEVHTESVDDLGAQIESLSARLAVFDEKLPEQEEVEVIIKEVWRLAREHKLTPKSVRTDKIVETAKFSELPMKMEIIGDFDGFYSFLLELEKLQRITRIPIMKLSKTRKQNEDQGEMQADLILSIFFEGKN
ncbi:MAG: type 4a pilus biogenesis protein PilO [Rhodospirillales bacterium]|nr:type 4a pilus biogenesis protein PilO [Rhodospirillales bacterium]